MYSSSGYLQVVHALLAALEQLNCKLGEFIQSPNSSAAAVSQAQQIQSIIQHCVTNLRSLLSLPAQPSSTVAPRPIFPASSIQAAPPPPPPMGMSVSCSVYKRKTAFAYSSS